MISPSIDDSGNAFIALAHRAKATPAPVLVACEIAGFGTALAVCAIAPSLSKIAFPFLAIGAFGLWGIVDHLLESPPRLKSWRRSALRAFQLLVAITGIAFAIATGFVAAGWLMGTFVL